MRARAGSVVKRKGRGDGAKATWWARVTYTDPVTGKRHDRQRRAESKIHAKELVHVLLAKVDSHGTDERAVYDQARAQGVGAPYLVHVVPKVEAYVGGWLAETP